MVLRTERIDNLLSRLATIPARIAEIVTGRSSDVLRSSSSQEEWSALQILAHLRASDDIITPRVYGILVRDEPTFLAFDERRWADVARYMYLEFHTSLQLFALRRNELVQVLRQLSLKDWERSGIHEVHGPQTVFAILTAVVEHEEEHCAQLSAIYR